jgi:hypothetical protein
MARSRSFSVTVHIPDDLAAAYCLRGLAFYSERGTGRPHSVVGTQDEIWRNNGHKMVFHFTSEARQQEFLTEAARLLAKRWTIAS